MSQSYRIPKGTVVSPFTMKYDMNGDWHVTARWPDKDPIAQEDWYFLEDDILPFNYDDGPQSAYWYVRVPSKGNDDWNGFSVLRRNVFKVRDAIKYDMWGNPQVIDEDDENECMKQKESKK